MARACRFTTPYSSREIYLDGKPFITIHRPTDENSNGPRPTDVDTVSREIKKLLCGEKRTKSSLAGLGFWPFKKKSKVNPMTRRMMYFPPAAPNVMTKNTPGPMARRGQLIVSGAKRKRRR